MSKKKSRQYHAFARVLLACGAALVIIAGTMAPQSSAAKRRTHIVSIRDMKYLPANLVVNVGDTVVWKNEDMLPHTVTDRAGNFDSGTMASGASWSYVVNKKGTYSYYCTFHPTMKGRLSVR